FISNARKTNRLAQELRLRNIEQFQYKEPEAIPTGSNWQDKILTQVEACNVFVALIGDGYDKSEWSLKEMEAARARESDILGSRLIKSTIQELLQDTRRRDSCGLTCRSGWRCA